MNDTVNNKRSLINGQAATTLSIMDRGLQYGDGLFETLALNNGEINNWTLHWGRLADGCQRLFIPLPDEKQLLAEIDSIAAGFDKEIVKIILTRGVTSRGYAFTDVLPTRVVSAYPWPALVEENITEGIELFVCQTNIARQVALAGIKHLNRLENVLARHEWQNKQYPEGIMLDTENNVIEGTMTNLFMVKDNILQTPDLSFSGVKGVTRQRIIDFAIQKGIPLKVKNIKMEELIQADEVFVCNTVINIWPVKKINRRVYPIDKREEAANPVTRLLLEALF